jgi:hypothetical protein
MTHVRKGQQGTVTRLATACGLLAAAVAGCGPSGPERAVVTGAVTYEGQTIADGMICFIPRDGTTGPSMVAAVTGGNYKVDTWGGLPVGSYRVEITAFRNRSRGTLDGRATLSEWESKFPREQYLPAKYNTNTELKTTIESGHRSLTRDFTLTD